MANQPRLLPTNSVFVGSSGPTRRPINRAGDKSNMDRKMQLAEKLVQDIADPNLRENALLELSKVFFLILYTSFISFFSSGFGF